MHTSRVTRASQETILASMVAAVHHYVGSAEIAGMLGVSRQRVQQLISRKDFPAPVVKLKMGKVWKRADVEVWAREQGRSPS